MVSYEEFCGGVSKIRERIGLAASKCGLNPENVKILPVTKNHSEKAVEYAFKSGFSSVGENRVMEALDKMGMLDLPVNWELIGHLQSNKAKFCAKFFRVQSVDSVKLLEKLDKAAESGGVEIRILLQINSGRDPAKFGAEIEDAPALAEAALKCSHLKLDGLMTIAPLVDDKTAARRAFAKLREIRDGLEESFKIKLPELSMGMSGDIEDAVMEGSTMVRVGTALFGERVYA